METPILSPFLSPSATATPIAGSEAVTPNAPVIQIGSISAFFSVALILVGIGIAWGKLQSQGGRIETSLDKEVRPDLKDIRERFSAVETKVETLWQYRFAPTVGAAHSPYRPTEVGDTLLKDSDLKKIIDNNWAAIEEEITKETTGGKDTPLDIERVALRYLERMVDEETYKAVRSYASNHPEHGLSVILLVGSWYIRGKHLKEDWIDSKIKPAK